MLLQPLQAGQTDQGFGHQLAAECFDRQVELARGPAELAPQPDKAVQTIKMLGGEPGQGHLARLACRGGLDAQRCGSA